MENRVLFGSGFFIGALVVSPLLSPHKGIGFADLSCYPGSYNFYISRCGPLSRKASQNHWVPGLGGYVLYGGNSAG